jgi:hypothetical protein
MNLNDREKRTCLELRTAAKIAGLSERHCRRVVVSEAIPVIWVGRKAILRTRDFEKWKRRRRAVEIHTNVSK